MGIGNEARLRPAPRPATAFGPCSASKFTPTVRLHTTCGTWPSCNLPLTLLHGMATRLHVRAPHRCGCVGMYS